MNPGKGSSQANPRPKTLFIDIDGCIFKHHGNLQLQAVTPVEILPGVQDKLDEWDRKGYNIILTSGRRESMRAATEKQLQDAGIFYDMLILGLGGGTRVIINDQKPHSDADTATAVNLTRNEGLGKVQL